MCDWSNLRVVHVNEIASVASVLAAAQRRRGAWARVIDPPKPLAGLPYPWKVLSFPLRGFPIAATAAYLRRERRAIAHVHYATQGIAALMARRRFVIHCHGSDVRGARQGDLRGRYLAPILTGATLVLYATPDLGEDVRPLRDDAVFMPNPIDVTTFAPGGSASHDVLMPGRLDEVKGARVAIAGLAGLLDERPATRATVIAHGPLAGWARSLLGSRARFLPPVPHEAMPSLLRDHRIVLGQFQLGILSQVELEALACGIPVVTDFRHDGAYDEPPPLARAQSAAEVADRLEELLDDEAALTRRAAAGRAWVLAHHDADRIVERLCKAYVEAGLLRDTGGAAAGVA